MRRLGRIVGFAARHRGLLAVLAIELFVVAVYGPTLLEHAQHAADPWTFTDDVRIQIHPQFRLEDGTLFPGDPGADYYLATQIPEGYGFLYRVLGTAIGVTLLSKVLPYLMLALMVGCLGRAAWILGGPWATLGTLALALGATTILSRMTGGLPRSFAFPLMAAGALALIEGRARVLAAIAAGTAAFYPVVSFTLGATLGLLLVSPPSMRGGERDSSLKARGVLLAITALCSLALVLPWLYRIHGWGPAIGPELRHAYPEAGPGGRLDPTNRPPFPFFWQVAFEQIGHVLFGQGAPLSKALNLRAGATWLVPLASALAAVGWFFLARRRVEARRLLLLLLAVVVCHTLAVLLEPRLFTPQRHLAYGLPVVALLAIPSSLGFLVESKSRWQRALPALQNVVLLALVGGYGDGKAGYSVVIPEADRPLFGAIAALPRECVVAAFPTETSDSIPYLARRSVYLSREFHQPFHARFTDLMRARAQKLFAAYFASSPRALARFRDEARVTHLLINAHHFHARPTYFAPFDRDIAVAFADGQRHGFAALGLVGQLGVVQAGAYTLLDLRRLTTAP